MKRDKNNLIIKLLSLCVSIALVSTMIPINVFASETVAEEETTTVEKEENIDVPAVPTLNYVTSTVIVLNGVDNCEYSLNGEVWQESYVFEGLQPSTTYTLYQRYAETETVLASVASEPLEVTTKGKSINVISPELVSVEGNIVTLEAVSGYEYKYLGGEWQDDNVFVLDSFTSYEFVQREKETEVTEASDDSSSIFASTGRITELPEGAVGIYTKADLDTIRNNRNSSDHYILMNNLNFIDADFEEYGEFYNDGCGWTPISILYGKIDGNGYSIRNLKSFSDEKAGFISSNYGQIINLAFENAEFTVSNESSTKSLYLAGIARTNRGVIEGCSISGEIVIKNKNGSYVSSAYAGGICCSNYGEIKDCSNVSTISVEAINSAYAGGIAGRNDTDGVVEDCYNKGEIITFINDTTNDYTYAGGIVGSNYGYIKTCYNIGVIDSRRNDSLIGAYSGGIVGDNNDGAMENCYYSELQRKASGKGVTIGSQKLTLSELKQQDSYVGFDFNNTWSMGSEEFATPYLTDKVELNLTENSTQFDGGKGIVFSPYRITTKEQLANVNKHLGAAYVLENDLSFEEADFQEGGTFYNDGKGWISLGNDRYKDFEGLFDGKNYTISGIFAYNQKYIGVFGCVTGEIKNLNVKDIYIENSSVNPSYAGGLAGLYTGNNLVNCTSDVIIKIDNTYDIYAGGLVGFAGGNITQSSAISTISLESLGSSGNEKYGGGLAGACSKSITDSYSFCDIHLKHYNISSGYDYVGGIVGNIEGDVLIENCYTVSNSYINSKYTQKDCSTNLYGGIMYNGYSVDVVNSYVLYDNGSVLVNGKDVVKTTEQFSSGEVTYLLNNENSNSSSLWRQNIGENGDAYPVLDTGHDIVYKCDKYNCQNQLDGCIYANINEAVYEEHDIVYYEAQEATCANVGWEAYEACAKCGYSTYKEKEKLEHTWENDYTVDENATCTEDGSKSIHCSKCDAKTNVTTIEALGHEYKVITVPATLSVNGSITEKCDSCGEATSETIYKISSVSLSTTAYTYDGKTKTPSVTVKDSNNKNLVAGKDYDITYSSSSRKSIGRYSVKVSFMGNYSGSKTLNFTIGPKKPSSVKAVLYGYNDVKVSWSKVSGATGYIVYYKKSTSSTWSSKSTTGTSVKLANLADGVNYNIKIVAYKTVKGYKCYNAGKSTSIYTLKKISDVNVAKSGSKVKISWTNIPGESGYQISKSTKKSGTIIVSTYITTSGKSKTVSATKGKTYYYKVRAYKVVSGNKIYGPWSAAVKYVRK